MQETEKQFTEIVERGYNDYQNYPNNLIRFASDHKMRQSMDFRDSSIDEESKRLAIDIIEDAVQNLVDHESATKIIGIFRGDIKWSELKKPFEFHQFIQSVFRGALGTKEERDNFLKEASAEERDLYADFRTKIIKAWLILNKHAYPACVLYCLNIYPDVATNTERLKEVIEYFRVVTVEERETDIVKQIQDKAAEIKEDDNNFHIIPDDEEYLASLFVRYSKHDIMDPDKSVSAYARELEKTLNVEVESATRLVTAIETHIAESLGPDAQVKVYGKTPVERAANDGRISVKIAIKIIDDEHSKTPSGISYTDALVALCGKENVQFLPKQEGYLPSSYLTGKIEL